MRASTFVVVLALSAVSVARADVVTAWNSVALDAIRANRTPPPQASRALAILHASIYDAINGITRSHQSYHVKGHVPASASIEAAASAAAHTVLVALFPSESMNFDHLHTTIAAGIPAGPHRQMGFDWGEYAAREMLAWRANDN